MLTKTVDLSEAQTSLRELLSLVLEGTEVILTEGKIPIARLMPIESETAQRTPGLHLGAISISDDFDQPLSEEFWMGN